MADPKKISSSIRPIIESILNKAASSGNISPAVLEKRIKELDLIDAGKKIDNKKKGGQMKKKKKKKFPDLNNDGKVTMKDVLIGRGVIKKAKVGMQMKGTSPLLKKRK